MSLYKDDATSENIYFCGLFHCASTQNMVLKLVVFFVILMQRHCCFLLPVECADSFFLPEECVDFFAFSSSSCCWFLMFDKTCFLAEAVDTDAEGKLADVQY